MKSIVSRVTEKVGKCISSVNSSLSQRHTITHEKFFPLKCCFQCEKVTLKHWDENRKVDLLKLKFTKKIISNWFSLCLFRKIIVWCFYDFSIIILNHGFKQTASTIHVVNSNSKTNNRNVTSDIYSIFVYLIGFHSVNFRSMFSRFRKFNIYFNKNKYFNE